MKLQKSTLKSDSIGTQRRLPIARVLLITAISLSIAFYLIGKGESIPQMFNEAEEEEREFEEREGIPSILKSFDAWSQMRSYPAQNLEAASVYSRAYEQSLQMTWDAQNTTARTNRTNTPPWVNLGPMNFGGRILSIGFHPTNANIMWVGSASGGLWKTTTGGTGGPGGISWQYVPTGFPVLGVSSIVVNPEDPNEIYIGTGEVYNPNAAATGSTGAGHIRLFRGSYGIGILKTVDGGTTWTKTLDFTNSNIMGVMDMLINPNDPDTVFAACSDGIYRTMDGGATPWVKILDEEMPMDMVFKPGNYNVIYSGVGNFQSPNNGIYKTTNANAATPTFTKLTSASFPNPISGKIMLAISANNPNRVYASIGRNPDMTSHTQGLWVSTNEGSTWAPAGAASILGNQGWYGHDVAASPTNANRVLWGELDAYLSTNGGSSFVQEAVWSNWDPANTTVGDLTEGAGNTTNYVHADIHRIEASPHDATGNTFFLCTDGGLFRTTNGGTAFNTLNGGLNTIQIYANMAQHPTNANYTLLGLQDNEAAFYNGAPGVARIGGLGDGFHCTMNSDGSVRVVQSYYFNRKRWTGSWGASSGQTPELACFNVPLVWSQTPGSPNVYAGTIYFKRSTNSANGAFTDLNGGAPIAGPNNPGIAMVAPTDNVVYFSTAPGGVVRSKLWKTTNANAAAASVTFTEITGTLPDRYYSDVEADAADPNRVFVTLSGFGTSHVYMSLNGGTSWTDIGGNLPDVPVNCIMVNPNNRQQIYIGNDLGVYYANQIPTSGTLLPSYVVKWTKYNEGIDDAIMVSDIQITGTDILRLGTYGRGLWERVEAPYTNLPVHFVDFSVKTIDLGNLCTWNVADQVNVARYEVEYSTNGTNFTKIASVPVKSGTGEIKYEYLHRIHNEVDGYYRVKSIDLDGSLDYTPVRMVKAQRRINSLTAFPNPSNGVFQLRVPLTRSGTVHIQVFAADGKLVETSKLNLQQGTNIIPMNILKHANGMYRVVCTAGDVTWKINVVKK